MIAAKSIVRVCLTLACLLIFASGSVVRAQAVRPVNKTGLFKVLRDHSLPTDELVQIVRERGVDFSISSEDERELLNLGGDASLIDAVKNGLKGPLKSAEWQMPDGPPLGQPQVLLLLEAQVDQDAIRKLIELRGTTITMSKGAASELTAAGASSALIGTLLMNQREAPKPGAAPARTLQPALVQIAQAQPAPQTLAAPPQLQGQPQTQLAVPNLQTQALPPAPQPKVQPQPQPQPAPPPAPSVAKPAVPSGPIHVDSFTQAQKLKNVTRPIYPSLAQRMKVQGRVSVEALVAADGTAKSVKAIAGALQLRQAAEEAVRKWVWEPTLVNGVPVEVICQVVLDFKIMPPK